MAFTDDARLVSLHATPLAEGEPLHALGSAHEIAGSGYVRQPITWIPHPSVAGSWWSSWVTLNVPGNTNLTHVGFWTQNGATFLGALPIAASADADSTFEVRFRSPALAVEDEGEELGDNLDVEVDPAAIGIVAMRQMAMEILDPSLKRAPTTLTLILSDALPDSVVDFFIGDTKVASVRTTSDGALGPTSIPVPEPFGIGEHVLTAIQSGALAASDTFTLANDPQPALIGIGPDADPVQVPGAARGDGSYRWVLQDLLPGGIGSWVMPISPSEFTTPFVDNRYSTRHTTARSSGGFHVTQGGTIPHEWQFAGLSATKEMYEQLLAYRNLNRRFYIIDHRNRAWVSVITDLQFDFRLPTDFNGDRTDWVADYTAEVLAFSQVFRTPQ